MALFRRIYLGLYIWLIEKHLLAVIVATASATMLGVIWIFSKIVMRGYTHG